MAKIRIVLKEAIWRDEDRFLKPEEFLFLPQYAVADDEPAKFFLRFGIRNQPVAHNPDYNSQLRWGVDTPPGVYGYPLTKNMIEMLVDENSYGIDPGTNNVATNRPHAAVFQPEDFSNIIYSSLPISAERIHDLYQHFWQTYGPHIERIDAHIHTRRLWDDEDRHWDRQKFVRRWYSRGEPKTQEDQAHFVFEALKDIRNASKAPMAEREYQRRGWIDAFAKYSIDGWVDQQQEGVIASSVVSQAVFFPTCKLKTIHVYKTSELPLHRNKKRITPA